MNQEMGLSLLRSVLVMVGTYLTGAGYTSSTDWVTLSGSILAVAPVIWGIVDKRKASMVEKVNNMTEVKGVITQDTPAGRALAASVPSPCVTSAGTAQAQVVAEVTHSRAE